MARVPLAIFALALFLSVSCFIDGVAARTTLRQNEVLLQNQSLINGNNLLLMHPSCNLVLFNGPKQVWETNTTGKAQHSCWAQLLENGNFVVFGDNGILWSSNTGTVVGKYYLVLLDSGNIAIAKPCPMIWSPNIETNPVDGKRDHDPNFSAEMTIKKFVNRY